MMVTPDGKKIPYVQDPVYSGMDTNGNFNIVTQNPD